MKMCATCPYWVKDEGKKLGEFTIGGCRRYPPETTITVTPHAISGQPMQNVSISYPVTLESHWCGEHPENKPANLRIVP